MEPNDHIPKENKPLIHSENLFPVVGIGASAGGLEAFKKLIHAIPADSGMAYVLVQHLDPNHESILPELLQKVTAIPVLEISDDIKVLPNHIYIIPSNKMLIANDGVLQLSPRPEKNKNKPNLPIDLFFASLAEVHQSNAIGVVLSGTASDGTAGLKSIKDQGGISFAQDEASAAYDSMPKSAVMAGVVDFILPPQEIPGKLIEIKKQISLTDEELENFPPHEEDIYKQILSLLRIRKGNDFTYYKQTTIRRRILRRMTFNKSVDSASYLQYLSENKNEQDALYQDFLIPVTEFFRDHKIFEHLCDNVFPELLKNKTPGEPIRVWVAGCSTGQEAYSMAICLQEFLGGKQHKAQIFATDISEPAIAKARTGIYTRNEVESIAPARLQEFFTKTNTGYRVNKQVREMCVFAVHNFLRDAPFGNIDFVSCRNVLIYMEPYLQKRALTTFHYALNPKAYLLLGKSETSSTAPALFGAAAKKDKLFTRKDVPGRFMHVASLRSEKIMHDQNTPPDKENGLTDFQKTADEIMLSKYTPSGVVINEDMDIVQFRGKTGNYLEHTTGKPSHNLLKMAKTGLAFELRNIISKAKKEKGAVRKQNIPVQVNTVQHLIDIEAIPLPNMMEPHYLILFHDITSSKKDSGEKPHAKTLKAKTDEKDLYIRQLEDELAQLREDMRGISDEQEAANEELQSANEELLSGSEELQSLNEELETSKEELQSTNEELSVVNQETINLNEQITDARDYAEAIIATIREPLLVLDENLRVKSANNAFYKMFGGNILQTEGTLIYDLGDNRWNLPELHMLFKEILPHKTKFINFEIIFDFPGIGKRNMLLNAREMVRTKGQEKLVLLAIEDITDRLALQFKENELLRRFQDLVIQAPVAVCILKGAEYVVEVANNFYLDLIDHDKNFIGKPMFHSLPELENQGMKEILDNIITTGARYYGNEVELYITRNKKNEQGFFNFVYQPMFNIDREVIGIIVVANEVTEQVKARKIMELQAAMIQELIMTAPGFVCTLEGPKHVYKLINERYQQLFGKREIQGKPIMVALPELKGQGFIEILDNVYKTGEPFVGIDLPLTLARDVHLEPEVRYFNFSYQPMYNRKKKIYSILVFGYEVTDQVNANNKLLALQLAHARELEEKVALRTAELSEANKKLTLQNSEKENRAAELAIANSKLIFQNSEKESRSDELEIANQELQFQNEEKERRAVELITANRELESFAYISSHDLQEPLRKIQLFSGRILESGESETLSASGKNHFERIRASAFRMQTLIEDLLSYSRASLLEVKFEKSCLNDILDEVKLDMAELILEKNVVIESGNLCEANINASQLRQVMNNLIGNSIKFARSGTSPHITIKSKTTTGNKLKNKHLFPDRKYCHISFTDNGIGFDPLYKDKIFEVFQRLHQTEDYEGTGIGLAIVKKIIENHQGIITASGVVNKGTTFDIFLPTN